MIEDRRQSREDARLILRAFKGDDIDEDKALDLLGFGEPLSEDGPRARPR